jgi:hypothetical protein
MKQYFIHNGRSESGPFNFDQLKQMHISKDSLVWYEGLQKWVKATSVSELQDILSDNVSSTPIENIPVLDLSKKRTAASNKSSKRKKKYLLNPDQTKKTALTIWIIFSILMLVAMYLYLKP